jgi:hypothetical protein
MSDDAQTFEEWAIVEIMGHQRYAGRVTEQTIGGCSFVRVDVPAIDGHAEFTKLFGQSSIFCISPCDQSLVRAVAEKLRSVPLSRYELPEEWQRKFAISLH